MQLGVRDVARAFQISDRTIYDWIKAGRLPAHLVNGQYRFNRTELIEWATIHQRPVPPELLQNEDEERPQHGLVESIEAGGIIREISGADKESVLKVMVDTIRVPEGTDREFLFRVLLAREALGSTGVGDGIAIPHPRNPIVLYVDRPAVAACFLRDPIEFGALDGKPVHTLFMLVSPTVQMHLEMLSRLAIALRDPGFKSAVARRADDHEILAAARRAEARVKRPFDGPGKDVA